MSTRTHTSIGEGENKLQYLRHVADIRSSFHFQFDRSGIKLGFADNAVQQRGFATATRPQQSVAEIESIGAKLELGICGTRVVVDIEAGCIFPLVLTLHDPAQSSSARLESRWSMNIACKHFEWPPTDSMVTMIWC